MIYKHFTKLPEAYELEQRADGRVNVWLCRQIDTYVTADGLREYDVDVRVIHAVDNSPELETDIRFRWQVWWDMAAPPGR